MKGGREGWGDLASAIKMTSWNFRVMRLPWLLIPTYILHQDVG